MAKLPKEITDEIYQSGYEKGFNDGYDKANATFELEYYQGHTLGEAYSDGKLDGAREFAEWLLINHTLYCIECNHGDKTIGCKECANEYIDEWQEGGRK